MNDNSNTRPQLDWSLYEARARDMSEDQLAAARRDAYAAGEAAWFMERKGELLAGAKDQGYYMDECSVYAAEQHRRNRCQRDKRKADTFAAKWVRGLDIDKLCAAGPDKLRAVLEGAVRDGWSACAREVRRG